MPASVKEEIPIFFNAKEIAFGFKKMTVDVIKTTSQEVTGVWFHSDCDAELYLFKDKNTNIIKQQLIFCGQLVEWNIVEGVRTGALFEEEFDQGAQFQEDYVMDKKPIKVAVEQAQDIISFIDQSLVLEKDEILSNYVDAPQLSHMNPKEVLKKYSGTEESITVFQRMSKRVRHLFKRLMKK